MLDAILVAAGLEKSGFRTVIRGLWEYSRGDASIEATYADLARQCGKSERWVEDNLPAALEAMAAAGLPLVWRVRVGREGCPGSLYDTRLMRTFLDRLDREGPANVEAAIYLASQVAQQMKDDPNVAQLVNRIRKGKEAQTLAKAMRQREPNLIKKAATTSHRLLDGLAKTTAVWGFTSEHEKAAVLAALEPLWARFQYLDTLPTQPTENGTWDLDLNLNQPTENVDCDLASTPENRDLLIDPIPPMPSPPEAKTVKEKGFHSQLDALEAAGAQMVRVLVTDDAGEITDESIEPLEAARAMAGGYIEATSASGLRVSVEAEALPEATGHQAPPTASPVSLCAQGRQPREWDPDTELQRVLAFFGNPPQWKPGRWRVLCPVHDDHHPSLDITRGDQVPVVMICRNPACGATGEHVFPIINGTGPLAAPRPIQTARKPQDRPQAQDREKNSSKAPRGAIVAEYRYQDEDGQDLFKVLRRDPKGFAAKRYEGGKWIGGEGAMEGVRRVLYQLPQLLAADPAEPVFVCEGEKAVKRLRDLGLVATCSPFGAGKWADEYSPALAGRRVCILPDNDQAGRDHAAQVTFSLHGLASEVRTMELPGLPLKGDVVDWIEAGGTAEELRRMATVGGHLLGNL